jgi:hypothetical protein
MFLNGKIPVTGKFLKAILSYGCYVLAGNEVLVTYEHCKWANMEEMPLPVFRLIM